MRRVRGKEMEVEVEENVWRSQVKKVDAGLREVPLGEHMRFKLLQSP